MPGKISSCSNQHLWYSHIFGPDSLAQWSHLQVKRRCFSFLVYISSEWDQFSTQVFILLQNRQRWITTCFRYKPIIGRQSKFRSHKEVFPDTWHWPIFLIRHPTLRLKIGRHPTFKISPTLDTPLSCSKLTLNIPFSKSTCGIAKYLTLAMVKFVIHGVYHP